MGGLTPAAECDRRKRTLERTVSGSHVTLDVIHHDGHLCQEFVVAARDFSLGRWCLWTAVFTALGLWLQLHTQNISIMMAAIGLLLLALLTKLHFKVKKESLFVISSAGVQVTTTFLSGRTKAKFYDRTCIKALVINEGITMWKVIFYLTLLLKDKDSEDISKLVPLFQNFWPCLPCLKPIYNGVQYVLFPHVTDR